MTVGNDTDRKILSEMSHEDLMELFFTHIRSIWTVDGLYFLGIENSSGTEQATEIDRGVWEEMARIEAKRLKKVLKITRNDLYSMLKALQVTSWALDLEEKELVVSNTGDSAIFRNKNCRTQNTRIKKGFGEFPCKRVRFGYLKAFANEFNPDIEVACRTCPPDKHPADLWCEWEFKVKH